MTVAPPALVFALHMSIPVITFSILILALHSPYLHAERFLAIKRTQLNNMLQRRDWILILPINQSLNFVSIFNHCCYEMGIYLCSTKRRQWLLATSEIISFQQIHWWDKYGQFAFANYGQNVYSWLIFTRLTIVCGITRSLHRPLGTCVHIINIQLARHIWS